MEQLLSHTGKSARRERISKKNTDAKEHRRRQQSRNTKAAMSSWVIITAASQLATVAALIKHLEDEWLTHSSLPVLSIPPEHVPVHDALSQQWLLYQLPAQPVPVGLSRRSVASRVRLINVKYGTVLSVPSETGRANRRGLVLYRNQKAPTQTWELEGCTHPSMEKVFFHVVNDPTRLHVAVDAANLPHSYQVVLSPPVATTSNSSQQQCSPEQCWLLIPKEAGVKIKNCLTGKVLGSSNGSDAVLADEEAEAEDQLWMLQTN
jgi:hypothetical protein